MAVSPDPGPYRERSEEPTSPSHDRPSGPLHGGGKCTYSLGSCVVTAAWAEVGSRRIVEDLKISVFPSSQPADGTTVCVFDLKPLARSSLVREAHTGPIAAVRDAIVTLSRADGEPPAKMAAIKLIGQECIGSLELAPLRARATMPEGTKGLEVQLRDGDFWVDAQVRRYPETLLALCEGLTTTEYYFDTDQGRLTVWREQVSKDSERVRVRVAAGTIYAITDPETTREEGLRALTESWRTLLTEGEEATDRYMRAIAELSASPFLGERKHPITMEECKRDSRAAEPSVLVRLTRRDGDGLTSGAAQACVLALPCRVDDDKKAVSQIVSRAVRFLDASTAKESSIENAGARAFAEVERAGASVRSLSFSERAIPAWAINVLRSAQKDGEEVALRTDLLGLFGPLLGISRMELARECIVEGWNHFLMIAPERAPSEPSILLGSVRGKNDVTIRLFDMVGRTLEVPVPFISGPPILTSVAERLESVLRGFCRGGAELREAMMKAPVGLNENGLMVPVGRLANEKLDRLGALIPNFRPYQYSDGGAGIQHLPAGSAWMWQRGEWAVRVKQADGAPFAIFYTHGDDLHLVLSSGRRDLTRRLWGVQIQDMGDEYSPEILRLFGHGFTRLPRGCTNEDVQALYSDVLGDRPPLYPLRSLDRDAGWLVRQIYGLF